MPCSLRSTRGFALGSPRTARGRPRLEMSRDERSAARLVRSLEDLGDEELGLAHREPASDHDRRGLVLVATWQPGDRDRRSRREEAEPNVGLNRGIERLDEQKPPAHPALVAREAPRDLRLREAVVAIERPHEPGLLDLREAAPAVDRGDLDFGIGDAHAARLGDEIGPSEQARGVDALEAVEKLEAIADGEHDDGGELPMERQRATHRLDSGRLANAERGETLAEIGE